MARAWAKNARSLAALFQKVDDLLKAEKRHADQKCGSPASQRVGKHEMPRDGVRPRRIALTAGRQAEQEPHDPNNDREFAEKSGKYAYCRPFTKESLLYREIFEKYYPGQAEMIVDYWMPNKAWPNCAVNDPSARVLKNYGDSGK